MRLKNELMKNDLIFIFIEFFICNKMGLLGLSCDLLVTIMPFATKSFTCPAVRNENTLLYLLCNLMVPVGRCFTNKFVLMLPRKEG